MTDGQPPGRPWAGVLFDLDGTLADTIELILISFRHTMKTHLGRDLPDAHFLEGIGTPLPVQLRGFARSETEHEAMLDTYVTYQRSIHDTMVRPFPGVTAVLRALRRDGTPVGIVTSKGARIARRTMRVCGIGDSTHDLQAGQAAGTRTAAVGWGPIDRGVLEAESPDFFLERMEEVLDVFPSDAPVRRRTP